MAIKELQKAVKSVLTDTEKDVEKFIAKGGLPAESIASDQNQDDDHRMTIRVPKWLMAKIDVKRKGRTGKISRNLWILETIDKATKK